MTPRSRARYTCCSATYAAAEANGASVPVSVRRTSSASTYTRSASPCASTSASRAPDSIGVGADDASRPLARIEERCWPRDVPLRTATPTCTRASWRSVRQRKARYAPSSTGRASSGRCAQNASTNEKRRSTSEPSSPSSATSRTQCCSRRVSIRRRRRRSEARSSRDVGGGQRRTSRTRHALPPIPDAHHGGSSPAHPARAGEHDTPRRRCRQQRPPYAACGRCTKRCRPAARHAAPPAQSAHGAIRARQEPLLEGTYAPTHARSRQKSATCCAPSAARRNARAATGPAPRRLCSFRTHLHSIPTAPRRSPSGRGLCPYPSCDEQR